MGTKRNRTHAVQTKRLLRLAAVFLSFDGFGVKEDWEVMISGMQLGNIVWKFLVDNDINATKFYKSAYQFCKTNVKKDKNGEGHGTRYYYSEEDIIPALEKWKKEIK